MPRLTSTRCAVVVLGLMAAAPAAAVAQTPATATPGTVIAIGTASVKPTPADAKSNASIAAAVREARRVAIPRAIGNARARAALLAGAGGLTLGAVTGVADTSALPFFGSPYGEDGTFGPGRYCGIVTTFKRIKRPDGRVTRKATGHQRRCRVPMQVTATESVTFAAS